MRVMNTKHVIGVLYGAAAFVERLLEPVDHSPVYTDDYDWDTGNDPILGLDTYFSHLIKVESLRQMRNHLFGSATVLNQLYGDKFIHGDTITLFNPTDIDQR